jgi:hypothetical protein
MAELLAQQNPNFKRAASTKSLHQLASDPWTGKTYKILIFCLFLA